MAKPLQQSFEGSRIAMSQLSVRSPARAAWRRSPDLHDRPFHGRRPKPSINPALGTCKSRPIGRPAEDLIGVTQLGVTIPNAAPVGEAVPMTVQQQLRDGRKVTR
jgi:hypothetical protein